MVIFTKLFCAFFGSVAGGCLFYAFFYNGKNPARYVVFMVACGLLLGGWMGLEAGREIIKDSRFWPIFSKFVKKNSKRKRFLNHCQKTGWTNATKTRLFRDFLIWTNKKGFNIRNKLRKIKDKINRVVRQTGIRSHKKN